MKRLVCHPLLGTLLIVCFTAASIAADAKPNPPAKDAKAVQPATAAKEPSASAKPKKDEKAAKQEKPAKPKEEPRSKTSAKAEEKPKAPKSAKSEPSKYTVKKSPLIIDVELPGVFEANKMAGIAIRPEQWGSFTVLKAVKHGARVKRGDLLVAMETDDIDEAIAGIKIKLRLSQLSIRKAERQLAALEKLTPLDLAAAARSRRIANEDLDQLLHVDLPMARKVAEFSLRMSADSLAYQKEELRQLEKMYKADDLTEETEEIVLRRARDSVRRAEFFHEMAKLRHDETLKFSLPRAEENAKEETERTTLTAEGAKIILPLTLDKQRLDLEKMKIEQTQSEDMLKDLLADRALMVVKSPIDGVVYFGRFVDGDFTATSPEPLRRGASLPANKVFMTVVQPRPMAIRAETPEKDLQYVHAGLKGSARPTGYPDLRLSTIVADVAAIPSANERFDTKITVDDEGASAVMPGMTCTVKMIGYQKKDALTVPPSAVKPDPVDDEKHFVWLVDKKGADKKRAVTVGKQTDKEVEILKGLSEGDQVLEKYPKDDEADAGKK